MATCLCCLHFPFLQNKQCPSNEQPNYMLLESVSLLLAWKLLFLRLDYLLTICFIQMSGWCSKLCSTDTDRRISIGPIRIRGYVKFLQNLKAQRCIGVSDTDTQIRIGYVIRGHVEVSGLQRCRGWKSERCKHRALPEGCCPAIHLQESCQGNRSVETPYYWWRDSLGSI